MHEQLQNKANMSAKTTRRVTRSRHTESKTSLLPCMYIKVCSEVCVEPDLQHETSNLFNGASANSNDVARLDVSANEV